MRDRQPAHEPERQARKRPPERHGAGGRQRLDHRRDRRLLKDDDVGRAGRDDGAQRLLAAGAAAADVVAEQADHAVSVFSTSVRYGWPISSPRRYITKSRVPWILTGRFTISMSFSRSGTRSGAMSGSSSLNGRECTPGTKNPVSLKNDRIRWPTSVRSRSLVPFPSASKHALSFQRKPVTA